jgi:hypothetical protein
MQSICDSPPSTITEKLKPEYRKTRTKCEQTPRRRVMIRSGSNTPAQTMNTVSQKSDLSYRSQLRSQRVLDRVPCHDCPASPLAPVITEASQPRFLLFGRITATEEQRRCYCTFHINCMQWISDHGYKVVIWSYCCNIISSDSTLYFRFLPPKEEEEENQDPL